MTAFLLLKSLVKFLEQSVAEYAAAKGADGKIRPPRVFEWFLPTKNPRMEEKIDFPFIVANIVSGEDREQTATSILDSTVRINLTFGVYSESVREDGFLHPDGAYDLLNLMEHVRIELHRQRILERRFCLEKPYRWSIPEEQPYPLWVGEAQTIWTVQTATPQQEGVDLLGGKFDWE